MSLSEKSPEFFIEAGKAIGAAETIPELLKQLKHFGIELKEGEKILLALEELLKEPGKSDTFPRTANIEIGGQNFRVQYDIDKRGSRLPDGDGQAYTASLSLRSPDFPSTYLGSALNLMPGYAANREWRFVPYKNELESAITVKSEIEVRPELEGQGIGLGLILASNIITHDFIERKLTGNAQSITSTIEDAASSPNPTRDRAKWSSNAASLLGYEQGKIKTNMFTKEFKIQV